MIVIIIAIFLVKQKARPGGGVAQQKKQVGSVLVELASLSA